MADRASNKGSLASVVTYGVQLATTLQTFAELDSDTKALLNPLVVEVNATSAALRQLDQTLHDDEAAAEKQGRLPGYKAEGTVQVETLADQCGHVYRLIVALLHRARNSKGKLPDKDSEREPLNTDLGPGSLMIVSVLARGLENASDWLEPRIDRCQEQLRWLKTGLLVHLQLASLARLHLDHGPRPSGAFDLELGFRAAAERLRVRQLQIARKVVKRQDKAAADESEIGSDSDSETASELADDIVPQSADDSSAADSTSVPDANPVSDPATASTPESSIQNVEPGIHVANEAESSSAPAPSVPVVPLTPINASHCGKKIPSLPSPVPDNPVQAPPPYKAPETTDAEADFVIVEKPEPKKADSGVTCKFPVEPKSTPDVVAATPSNLSSLVPKWIQSIFGSRPTAGDAPANLEAYIADTTRSSWPIKVPLGDERLKFGIKSIQKNKTGAVWQNYMDMDSAHRGIVDDVLKFARTQSPHMRTCVGVEEISREGQPKEFLIFLSLADPLRTISFKDCVGRKYAFPFEFCKDWNVSIPPSTAHSNTPMNLEPD